MDQVRLAKDLFIVPRVVKTCKVQIETAKAHGKPAAQKLFQVGPPDGKSPELEMNDVRRQVQHLRIQVDPTQGIPSEPLAAAPQVACRQFRSTYHAGSDCSRKQRGREKPRLDRPRHMDPPLQSGSNRIREPLPLLLLSTLAHHVDIPAGREEPSSLGNDERLREFRKRRDDEDQPPGHCAASRRSFENARTWSSRAKSLTMRARAALPICSRRDGAAASRQRASAIPRVSRTGTTNPSIPSVTASAMPPQFVVTTGRAQAIASRAAFEIPSLRLDSRKTSAARRRLPHLIGRKSPHEPDSIPKPEIFDREEKPLAFRTLPDDFQTDIDTSVAQEVHRPKRILKRFPPDERSHGDDPKNIVGPRDLAGRELERIDRRVDHTGFRRVEAVGNRLLFDRLRDTMHGSGTRERGTQAAAEIRPVRIVRPDVHLRSPTAHEHRYPEIVESEVRDGCLSSRESR